MGYADVILGDAPIAYWRLGEATGTTGSGSVIDASGYASHATPNGGVTFGASGAIAGDMDSAATFDGSDDYVTRGIAEAVHPYTLEAWIYVTTDSGIAVGRNRTNSSIAQQGMGVNTAGKLYGRGDRLATPGVLSVTDIRGGWHHCVVVFNTTSSKLYVDGAEESTGTINAPPAALSLATIGAARHDTAPYDFLAAQIDEVAIYATALSADRILDHYNAGIGTTPPTSSLLRRRRMLEGA